MKHVLKLLQSYLAGRYRVVFDSRNAAPQVPVSESLGPAKPLSSPAVAALYRGPGEDILYASVTAPAILERKVYVDTQSPEAWLRNRCAARWQAAMKIGFPEYCPHWEGEPTGDGWYHESTGGKAFRSAEEAMDAAMAATGN